MKKHFLFTLIAFVSMCFALPSFAIIKDETLTVNSVADINLSIKSDATNKPLTVAGRGGRNGGDGGDGQGRGRGQGGQGGGNGGGGGGN